MNEQREFVIVFYRRETGTSPVIEFLESLKPESLAIIHQKIHMLSAFGMQLREPHTKPIENGLFELRIRDNKVAYRMIYFFVQGNKIIITHGFTKKTNKTPRKEIEFALKCKADYLSRN